MKEKFLKFWNKYKRLLLYIAIPLIIGFIGNLLGGSTDIYNEINTPSFAPPGWLFPIAWTILYTLMGISSYMVRNEKNNGKVNTIYYVQLGINALWSLLFFRLRLFAFSSIWLALLIAAVAYMIYEFYKLNKTAGLIQIPYLLWLGFAFLLNYSIYLLNR